MEQSNLPRFLKDAFLFPLRGSNLLVVLAAAAIFVAMFHLTLEGKLGVFNPLFSLLIPLILQIHTACLTADEKHQFMTSPSSLFFKVLLFAIAAAVAIRLLNSPFRSIPFFSLSLLPMLYVDFATARMIASGRFSSLLPTAVWEIAYFPLVVCLVLMQLVIKLPYTPMHAGSPLWLWGIIHFFSIYFLLVNARLLGHAAMLLRKHHAVPSSAIPA